MSDTALHCLFRMFLIHLKWRSSSFGLHQILMVKMLFSEFNRPLAPTSLCIHLENHTDTLEIKHLSASNSSRKFGRNNFTKGGNCAQRGIKATQALYNTHLCWVS